MLLRVVYGMAGCAALAEGVSDRSSPPSRSRRPAWGPGFGSGAHRMVVAALVIAVIALLLCGLVALAVMELLAERTGSSDQAEDLVDEFDLAPDAVGAPASSVGLPERMDRASVHMVLVVSPVCRACQRLARSFEGSIPDGVSVVVTAADPARMREWAAAQRLSPDELVFDDDMSVVGALGVSSSPSVVGVLEGRIAFGAGIGGRRALDDLLTGGLAMLGPVQGPAREPTVAAAVDRRASPVQQQRPGSSR